MAFVAWIALAAACLSFARSACENQLTQQFILYDGSSTLYSKDHAQQDFPSTKGPYKMIMGGDQGAPLTT
jgi:hypothetical protein